MIRSNEVQKFSLNRDRKTLKVYVIKWINDKVCPECV